MHSSMKCTRSQYYWRGAISLREIEFYYDNESCKCLKCQTWYNRMLIGTLKNQINKHWSRFYILRFWFGSAFVLHGIWNKRKWWSLNTSLRHIESILLPVEVCIFHSYSIFISKILQGWGHYSIPHILCENNSRLILEVVIDLWRR